MKDAKQVVVDLAQKAYDTEFKCIVRHDFVFGEKE